MESELRLLAAIMFTDIVGYTSLMQSDEKNAISIREKHRKVLEEKIQKETDKFIKEIDNIIDPFPEPGFHTLC